MNRKSIVVLAVWAAIGIAPSAPSAQGVQQSAAIASSDVLSQISMFSYRDGPKSHLLFRGTPIAASAEGNAQVEYQNGNARISASVQDLPKPASLGPYTNYLLWAVTPDGRATNQGVLAGPDGGKGSLETQYNASQFALIVTAEPHFAATVPSTMIVLYNVGDNVKGTESKVTTLTERANYSNLAAIAIDDQTTPLELVQARYAVAIARDAGAERFATPSFTTATAKLDAAETALRGKSAARKTAPGLAREAVIAGEDARRAATLTAAAANEATERRAAATAATDAAERVAAVATLEASAAAESDQRAAANAATDAAREVAAVAARQATADADAATAATLAAAEAAKETERLRSDAAAAASARIDLHNRLNAALPTRESSRGLISEIGGVQFATGNAGINESGRETLAKFSGIVRSYPTLRFNVEGHTDSVGSDVSNNALSLRRATTVRDYLIGQGVAASSIDVAGLGSSNPLADNSTADNRARNRRVEIVLSGGPL